MLTNVDDRNRTRSSNSQKRLMDVWVFDELYPRLTKKQYVWSRSVFSETKVGELYVEDLLHIRPFLTENVPVITYFNGWDLLLIYF